MPKWLNIFSINKKESNPKRIQLTSMEVSELLVEGIFTILIMLLLNVAIIMILSGILNDSAELVNIVYTLKRWFSTQLGSPIFYSWRKFLILGLFILDVWVVYWRLMRRYRQMQMRHIISELHYITMGNLDHRIPFELNGDLGNVVNSINLLVDSTVKAIEDERQIEKSKDELISNVSHDLRTPLTSIIGYLGLLETGSAKTKEDEMKYIHTAYEKAKQMKNLVEDLFEYTKVRFPNVEIAKAKFNMSSLLAQMAIDFALEAEKIGVEIIYNSQPENVMMLGDTEKLVRVFDNLISNALKYGRGATKIVLDIAERTDEIVIYVKNDGENIPEESLKHLFDRFYRVESSRSKETGGSGLGLAITKGIVELHDGTIGAKSEKGWTTFKLTFPKLPLEYLD
ncbi:MAG: HAMP domain-containing histidine kinase [Streptococcaceae bacterium]|jgi:signal transduction histidine kinase|nr:HAMP domain-containing histidine kinase [Streptococcaceae bacterium]